MNNEGRDGMMYGYKPPCCKCIEDSPRKPKKKKKHYEAPEIPDAFASYQPCVHLHFKTELVDRDCLTHDQYLDLLATPKGYRWIGEVDCQNPELDINKPKKKKKKPKKREPREPIVMRQDGGDFAEEFVEDMWDVMSPDITDRLIDFLVNEFGMSAEEAEDFIDCKCAVGNKTVCRRKKSKTVIGLGPKHKWVKEFSDVFAKRIEQYIVSMLMTRRTPRVKRIAERILEYLCDLTGERTTLQNPKTKIQRTMVLISDRLALWIDDLMRDIDKPQKYRPSITEEEESDQEKEPQEEEEEEEEKGEPQRKEPPKETKKEEPKPEKEPSKGEGEEPEAEGQEEKTDEEEKQPQAEEEEVKEEQEQPQQEEETPQEQPQEEEQEPQPKEEEQKQEEETPQEPEKEEETPEEEQAQPAAEQQEAEEEQAQPEEEKPAEEEAEEQAAEETTDEKEEETKPEEEETKAEEEETKAEEEEETKPDSEAAEAEEVAVKPEEEETPEEEVAEEKPEEEEGVPSEKEPSEVGEEPKVSIREPEKKPFADILDFVKEDIAGMEKGRITDRQKAVKDVVDRRIEKLMAGVEPVDGLEQEDIDDAASRVAHWVEQILGATEMKQPVPPRKSPGGAYVVKPKTGSTLEVNKLSSGTVAEVTAQVRGLEAPPRGRKVPASESPLNLKSAQEWADWASNIALVADEWGKWLQNTLTDAEKQLVEKRRGSQGTDWKQWRDQAQTDAMKFRAEKERIKGEGKVWDKKINEKIKNQLQEEVEVKSTELSPD